MPKYGVFSGPNKEKYGPEKNPYLGTFYAVIDERYFDISELQMYRRGVPGSIAKCKMELFLGFSSGAPYWLLR